MSVELEITVEHQDDWVIARASGELDMATIAELESTCSELADRLALDLSQIGFIDSSGLAALMRIGAAHDALVLLAPSDQVRRLLDLARVADDFHIVESIDLLGQSS